MSRSSMMSRVLSPLFLALSLFAVGCASEEPPAAPSGDMGGPMQKGGMEGGMMEPGKMEPGKMEPGKMESGKMETPK